MFLIPIETDQIFRQRIEAAIAAHLYDQDGIVGQFQDEGIRYQARQDTEDPVEVTLDFTQPILGLAQNLIV